MINFDNYTRKITIEDNLNWPYTPDYPYKLLSGGWKNKCIDLSDKPKTIDKICLYAKDSFEKKYQFLIKKRENVHLKHYNDPKASIKYSDDVQEVHRNFDKYNPGRKKKSISSPWWYDGWYDK